jgi:hypothetical protein
VTKSEILKISDKSEIASSERFPGSNPGVGVYIINSNMWVIYMNAFQRSWEITKLSFDVLKKDKELFLFPILGSIFSILFMVAMILPIVVTSILPETLSGLYLWITLFGIYFGLSFIAVFFNVATVYTVKTRFDGGNATFWDSIRFAFSKIHLIIGWSIISAIIGIILRLLEGIAERMGGIGEIIMKILIGMLGLAWSLVTAFVIPGMVYKNVGPFTAIKDSAHTFKKTWGESLIRHYGLGIAQFVMVIIGVVLTIVLVMITINVPVLPYIFGIIGVLYVVAVMTFFYIANTIFNTALYVYAKTGKAPKGYKDDVLRHAFEHKPKE